jgi:hypothetical protein
MIVGLIDAGCWPDEDSSVDCPKNFLSVYFVLMHASQVFLQQFGIGCSNSGLVFDHRFDLQWHFQVQP